MVRSRVALALLALVAFACEDDPTGPRFGYVRVSVQVTGFDADDSFEITWDSLRLTVASNAVSTLHLSEGPHSFELKGVAENCLVEGSSTASVTISRNDTTQVLFRVGCAATGIVVRTITTGGDIPSLFQVLVPSLPTLSILANGEQTYTRVPVGRYQVRLRTGVPHCAAAGDSIVAADVVNRQLTTVTFIVQCVLAPRTGAIAFVDNSRSTMVVMNADGSNQGDLNYGYHPSWSRDGTKLIYSTTECDYYTYLCTGSLAVVDPITRQTTNLTSARIGIYPDWSPIEDVIVYVNAETYRPYLFNVATSTSTPINIPENVITYHPSWSPDGTQIVASCYIPAPTDNSGLCIFNRDGSGIRMIAAADNSFLADPSWSPDGSRIVFSKFSSNPSVISTIKPDGTDLRSVVAGWIASWSPDGSEIIYAAQSGLFVIGQSGVARRLTTGNHYGPVWRP